MGRRKHRAASAAAPPAAPVHAKPPARPAASASGLWLYGRHAVLAALANRQRRVSRLLATSEAAASLAAAAVAAPIPRPEVEIAERRAIEALLPLGAVHQGFAALAKPLPATPLPDVLDTTRNDPAALFVVLDQVTDPRNVGAVLRSAQAFAAGAVLVQDRHAPEETGPLAKAASGALEMVPLVRVTNVARALRTLQDERFRCVGLAGEATVPLGKADLEGRIALVLGAEGAGLRRLVRETCDALVRIPIAPTVDSLNLSAAAAIGLYACACARSATADAGGTNPAPTPGGR